MVNLIGITICPLALEDEESGREYDVRLKQDPAILP